MKTAEIRRQLDPARTWEELPCPLCGGGEFDLLFLKAGEPFVRCRGCTLMMINPRPAFAEIRQTYTPDYSGMYIGKRRTKLRRISRWVRRIRRRFVSGGRWLDIGCSAGFVVYAAEQAGFEGYGVDVEGHGVRFATQELGLTRCREGLLEDMHYPDGHFDVITMYEVIEHVPDLNRFLAEVRRILAPGGVMEIRTPDVGHWRVTRPLSRWAAVIPSEHLYNFSFRTLSRLLEQNGLRVVRRTLSLKPGLKLYVRHADWRG